MHFLLNTLLLTLCHHRLTGLHGLVSPFLLLETWSLPLLLLHKLPDPLEHLDIFLLSFEIVQGLLLFGTI